VKWLKYPENKPETNGGFLVYESLSNTVKYDYWIDAKHIPLENGFFSKHEIYVTHFMPLPKPPIKKSSAI